MTRHDVATGWDKSAIRRLLCAPVPSQSLAAFRILYGLLMGFATLRFWAKGWIEELYLSPDFHFKYWGFDWVVVPAESWLYSLFVVTGLAAVGLSIGLLTRWCAGAFLLSFVYLELLEKATYLNHYYLASLLAALLVFVPCNQQWSVDAWRARRKGNQARVWVPAWQLWLFRIQVGLVYFYAGLAKINGDWLLRAEPLRTWLAVRRDVPWVGAWLAEPLTAYAMSYWGMVFDLTVAFWLLWPRTRGWAYTAVVAFHLSVWLLFPIGIFSWLMMLSATVLLSPQWPARWLRWARLDGAIALSASVPRAAGAKLPGVGLALAGTHLLIQLALPLRFALYPGCVNWHEQGYRFSWRVMLTEKSGQVHYRIATDDGRSFVVYPQRDLSPFQYAMMRTQPDMIHDYARHLRRRFVEQTGRPVSVHAEAWVSFNGRRSQRVVDPLVDLGSQPRTFGVKPWIVPLKDEVGGLVVGPDDSPGQGLTGA